MRIDVIIGTRPEAIKLAPIIRELDVRGIEHKIISTGQHQEILSQTLDIFDIKPNFIMDVLTPNQSLTSLGSKLMAHFDPLFSANRPDYVIVQGDTSSAFFGALSAFNQNIKVAHVEAGMRTGNITSPFPEEANRKMLSCLTSIHFAATNLAKYALVKEGIEENSIVVTGNTVVDAIHIANKIISSEINIDRSNFLDQIRSHDRPYVLITCHRRENFGKVIEDICQTLADLAKMYKNIDWIFPVHPNPNVRGPVESRLSCIPNLKLINPLDYLSTIDLLSKATLVLSDSGGIQEEAPTFGVPVVVMREHTERMEGVISGFALLAGRSPDNIIKSVRYWLDDDVQRNKIKNRKNPYGDGSASQRIISTLLGESATEFSG